MSKIISSRRTFVNVLNEVPPFCSKQLIIFRPDLEFRAIKMLNVKFRNNLLSSPHEMFHRVTSQRRVTLYKMYENNKTRKSVNSEDRSAASLVPSLLPLIVLFFFKLGILPSDGGENRMEEVEKSGHRAHHLKAQRNTEVDVRQHGERGEGSHS